MNHVKIRVDQHPDKSTAELKLSIRLRPGQPLDLAETHSLVVQVARNLEIKVSEPSCSISEQDQLSVIELSYGLSEVTPVVIGDDGTTYHYVDKDLDCDVGVHGCDTLITFGLALSINVLALLKFAVATR